MTGRVAGDALLTAVPVIDLAPLAAGLPGARTAVARAVDAACTDIGFFTITGHGVPEALVTRMLETARAFFDLPVGEKLAVKQPRPEQSRVPAGLRRARSSAALRAGHLRRAPAHQVPAGRRRGRAGPARVTS